MQEQINKLKKLEKEKEWRKRVEEREWRRREREKVWKVRREKESSEREGKRKKEN